MPDTNFTDPSTARDYLTDRLTPALILAFQALISILFITLPLLAYAWSQGLTFGEYWRETSARHASLLPLPFYWKPVDPSVSLNIFWASYLIGLVFRFSGLWVYYRQRQNPTSRIYAIFAGAAAFAIAGTFDYLTSQRLTVLWISAITLSGGALIHLALTFPKEISWTRRLPKISWGAYAPALFLPVIPGLTGNPLASARLLSNVVGLSLAFAILGCLVFLFVMLWRHVTSGSTLDRRLALGAFWGAAASVTPALFLAVWGIAVSNGSALPAAFLPLAVFPLSIGYALLYRRSQRTDALLIKAAAYTLTAGLTAAAYFLLLGGLSLIAGRHIPANQPLLIFLFLLILVVMFDPVHRSIQKSIASVFGRQAAAYQEEIQAFSQELTHRLELKSILSSLVHLVNRLLAPVPLHIFLYDSISAKYTAAAAGSSHSSTDLVFPENSGLVQALTSLAQPLYLMSDQPLPDLLHNERNRLAMLGANLFVSLPGQKRPVGWLALGPKSSGEPYTAQEVGFLDSLCNQAALAIEHALVIDSLERRVHEMDVLTRVAQGVNITPEFDDILELIYAQTVQVIPAEDFHITLNYPSGQGAYHAFFLQQDERMPEKENIQIPARQGLETQVIQSQRSLVTDDYERECRSHGILSDQPGILSWIGVPLNAGAQTIGAVSLGSRKPSTVYTDQQQMLLQAIADQAAGAIVKSRLLEASKKHAHQLATLNEVSRSLTSTLDIKPLLSQILVDASAILSCEVGILSLIDETTQELVVEAATGPISDDLVGKHISAGSGVIGKVAGLGEALIINHSDETNMGVEPLEGQTGVIPRDLIAVPLVFKGKTIGVIAGINKRDGTPFTPDDLELLSTLSSQAAIAIENARLYTQTDEALSARLEEMSVMQRIDRELNASLDVDRTMQLTLDWALAQAQANAGLIGFVEESEGDNNRLLLRVVAEKCETGAQSHRINHNPDSKNNKAIGWVDLEWMQPGIQSGLPHRADIHSTGDHQANAAAGQRAEVLSYWEGSASQVVIPIRRKSGVMGMIILESSLPGKFSNEVVTFLTRLSDHAAIAISNAMLYADLQSANIAKSEFVSLVSHELKTPMTSIRGYSDLLAQGTVGPVNEIQSNFLNTIRSNVNRMANLVSDLADVSRIEAGRLQLDFQAISVEDAVNEVVRSIQAQLNEKEHVLEVLIPAGTPEVWADLNRLIQIMNNLISNAIKYTPQNGTLAIRVEQSTNLWDASGAPEVIHISVADNGLGISTADQEKVFQKFFRSADQNIREMPGTGLGLNITRHLVEMQGGKIWFESEPGHGSIFHFTVPVAMTG